MILQTWNPPLVEVMPKFYKGTNGTLLGRCDRDALRWRTGPWDREPDVITWMHEGTLLVLSRQPQGRWEAFVFSKYHDAPLWQLADEATLARHLVIEIDHEEFAALGGFARWGLNIDVKPGRTVGIKPTGAFVVPPIGDHGYVTADEKLAELSRLLKAVNRSLAKPSPTEEDLQRFDAEIEEAARGLE